MSHTPSELKYTDSHEWIRTEADGTILVGITDHAQEALGDIVYFNLPEPGTHFAARKDVAVVESVKAASDIYAPVAGSIISVNQSVIDAPEVVNQDAYEAWLFKMQPDNIGDLGGLLDAEGYLKAVAE